MNRIPLPARVFAATAASAAAVAMLLSAPALAAVTAEEAARLKTTLTPLGAERGANKDGSIPAWDGGMTKAPAGFKAGDARPDPFPGEKPLYSISAKNMAQYESKLSDGVKALMKKYPDFRIEVYPTHRTAAAPQWVYDNTFKNATRAKLVDNGHGTEGAYGGTPFPIPKDGYEVFQNHRLAWTGTYIQAPVRVWVVTADGKRAMASGGTQSFRKQFYDSLLNDYYDRSRTIVVTTHQVEELQHVLTDVVFVDRGRVVLTCSMDQFDARFHEVMVPAELLDAARALHPLHERQVFGRGIFLFDRVERRQLATLGEVRTPNIADVFVAVMTAASESGLGARR